MNQGLGSRADDTGRAAPRAIPGAEEAEPPNLGCLQRLAKASDPRPQLISTTTSHHAPIGPTTPPPERTGGGEGGEGIALCRVFWVKAFFGFNVTFDGERRYLGRFSTALGAALHVARNLGPASRLEIAAVRCSPEI